MLINQTFGQALEALYQGKMVKRTGWDTDEAAFVFMQVPSEVPAAIIPKMTSLPAEVKLEVMARGRPLKYSNQLAIVYIDNSIHGWVASPADCLASDWCIIQASAVAGETVGVATPL